jgi:hypothetical protein
MGPRHGGPPGRRAGTRTAKRGERERGRGRESSPWGSKNLAITVTASPRARDGRERWKRGRGSCCAGKSNERKGERGRAWGKGGAPGVHWTGPG